MRFKQWFEQQTKQALLVVHPEWAYDLWAGELPTLKNYYSRVLSYVENFNGPVVIYISNFPPPAYEGSQYNG